MEHRQPLRRLGLVSSQVAAAAEPYQYPVVPSTWLAPKPPQKGGGAPGAVLFENARVKISDFRLPPGARAAMVHAFPTLRWQVEEGAHERDEGKAEAVKDKQVFFLEAEGAWRIRNAGDKEYRQIVFEFKQSPKHSEAEIKDLLARAKYSPNVGTELLFENRFCRVWDFYLPPGHGPIPTHQHTMDYVFVHVGKSRLFGHFPDGREGLFDGPAESNDVTAFLEIPDTAGGDERFAHGAHTGPELPNREYLVELK